MKKIGLFLNSIGQKMTITVVFVFFILSNNVYAKEKVVFGITGVALKEDMMTMRRWSEYIQKTSGIDVELRFARSYNEIKSMIETGRVDFAYVCGATYVELKPRHSASVLALPLSKGKPEYYSLMIVRKDSSIAKLDDLENKVFAFSDPSSNSGTIVPAYNVIRGGHCPKRFFKRVFFTYDHGESIAAVSQGFADGASVDSLVYESFSRRHPEKAARLKIIERYGPFPITPIVYRIGLNPSKVDAVRKAILGMSQSKEGRAILASLSVDRFVVDESVDYAPIETMIRYVKRSGI